MSLQTNVQHHENPFDSRDPLGRNLLWEFIESKKNPKEILNNDNLYMAVMQFSWFYPIQRECMYGNFEIKDLEDLTKYLKDKENK